jgi:hypothetical protein
VIETREIPVIAGSVVGVGQGVQVFLGGAEAAVPEPFFDDLDVGAAGQQPGGVRVPHTPIRTRSSRAAAAPTLLQKVRARL